MSEEWRKQGLSFDLSSKEDLFKRISKAHKSAMPEYFDESKENQYGKVAEKPETPQDFEDYDEEGVNTSQQVRPEGDKEFIKRMDTIMQLEQLQSDSFVQSLKYGKALGEKYGTFHSNEDLFDKAKEAAITAGTKADQMKFQSMEEKQMYIDALMKEMLEESMVPSEYHEDVKSENKPMTIQLKSGVVED